MGTPTGRLSIFICILLVLILGCAKEPAQPQLLKSMAELDRVYIPALMFTNLQKQRESEIAFERFKKEWDKFNQKYYNLEFKYGVDITDKFWQEDFDAIDGAVATAEGFIKEGKLVEAHQKLEKVRALFKELRFRNGLEYFLDGMTEFHDAMEQIILTIRGKDQLTDRDFMRLRSLFKEAQAAWADVANAEIDPLIFGFDSKKVDAVKKRIKEEEKVLASFAAALSSRNADRIFQAATDLKPNFVVLYKAFGDFQPIFDKIIEERKTASAEALSEGEGDKK